MFLKVGPTEVLNVISELAIATCQTVLIYFSFTWPHRVLEVTKIAKSTPPLLPKKQPVIVVVKRN